MYLCLEADDDSIVESYRKSEKKDLRFGLVHEEDRKFLMGIAMTKAELKVQYKQNKLTSKEYFLALSRILKETATHFIDEEPKESKKSDEYTKMFDEKLF